MDTTVNIIAAESTGALGARALGHLPLIPKNFGRLIFGQKVSDQI